MVFLHLVFLGGETAKFKSAFSLFRLPAVGRQCEQSAVPLSWVLVLIIWVVPLADAGVLVSKLDGIYALFDWAVAK